LSEFRGLVTFSLNWFVVVLRLGTTLVFCPFLSFLCRYACCDLEHLETPVPLAADAEVEKRESLSSFFSHYRVSPLIFEKLFIIVFVFFFLIIDLIESLQSCGASIAFRCFEGGEGGGGIPNQDLDYSLDLCLEFSWKGARQAFRLVVVRND
jgi:hypothetical protein